MKAKKKVKKESSGALSFVLSLCITLLVGGGLVFLFREPLLGVAQNIGLPFGGGTGGQQEGEQVTLLSTTPRAGDSYLADTVFVGDSRTNGLKATGEIDEDNIVAVDGMCHSSATTQRAIDTGSGRLKTIPEAIEELQPERIVINFGINGIAWLSEEQFISDYEALLDQIEYVSPDTTIIVESILPVSSYWERSDGGVSNEKIDAYNELLLQMAEDRGLYYLDSASALKDEDGDMDSQYDSGDGLHYNTDGYEVVIEQVLTHAVEE